MNTNAIKANVRCGRLELQVPPEWPDGTEVEVRRVGRSPSADEESMGDDEINRTLAAMDAVMALELSDDERGAIERERLARKEKEVAQFDARAERLGRGWP